MYHLSINTSYGVSLGLLKDVDLVDSINITKDQIIASDEVLLLIEDLLKKNNISVKDLSFLSLVRGPGYFTSLRVGVVIAKILQLVLKIPTISFSSFYVMAKDYYDENKANQENILSCCNIGKKGLLVAIFDNKLNLLEKESYLEDESMIDFLLRYQDDKIQVVGQNQEEIKQVNILKNATFNNNILIPSIYKLGILGLTNYKAKKFDEKIVPFYLKDFEVTRRKTINK